MRRNATLNLTTALPEDQMTATTMHGTTSASDAGSHEAGQSSVQLAPLRVQDARAGDYVTYGPSRVMVIDRLGDKVVVLEDPFYPKGTYPIEVKYDDFSSKVMRTTEERVRSEYERLRVALPECFGLSDPDSTEASIIQDKECQTKRSQEETPARDGHAKRNNGVAARGRHGARTGTPAANRGDTCRVCRVEPKTTTTNSSPKQKAVKLKLLTSDSPPDEGRFVWEGDRDAADNYTALGKALAPGGDLYRSPAYGGGLMMMLPDGKYHAITKGARPRADPRRPADGLRDEGRQTQGQQDRRRTLECHVAE